MYQSESIKEATLEVEAGSLAIEIMIIMRMIQHMAYV